MGRHGYTDDDSHDPGFQLWRGRVASATRGKRGQAMLKGLLFALDNMPNKRLVKGQLVTSDGECCTTGCLLQHRKLILQDMDTDDEYDQREFNEIVARLLDVSPILIQEIEWHNDEVGQFNETPEKRWERMRKWVASQIKPEGALAHETPTQA